jgi:hypothetical protein
MIPLPRDTATAAPAKKVRRRLRDQRRPIMRKVIGIVAALTLPALALAANYKYHDLDGEFVSADTKTNTFMVKFDDGSTSSGKAEGAAAKSLGTLKAGDKITITCKDNEKGEHLSATAIKVAK